MITLEKLQSVFGKRKSDDFRKEIERKYKAKIRVISEEDLGGRDRVLKCR